MKNLMTSLFLSLVILSSCQCYGSNLKPGYLKELKSITHIKGDGDNKLFLLIGNSADELVKSWSPELAKELARVFNELLNVNQNYFLVELIDPVVKKYPKRFNPILNKALSDKNKKVYKDSVKMDRREDREGNDLKP